MNHTKSDLSIGENLQLQIIPVRGLGVGVIVRGKVHEHGFEALLVPRPHPLPAWSLDGGTIRKLEVREWKGDRLTYSWDGALEVAATDVPTQKVVNFLTRGLSERADRIMELGNSHAPMNGPQTPSTAANSPRHDSSQTSEEHKHWERAINQLSQGIPTIDSRDSQKPSQKMSM